MSTTTTKTSTQTVRKNGITIKTKTTVEKTTDPSGKVTKKTTIEETTTNPDGSSTTTTKTTTETKQKAPSNKAITNDSSSASSSDSESDDEEMDEEMARMKREMEQEMKAKKEEKRKEKEKKRADALLNQNEEKNVMEFFQKTNEYRISKGLDPLRLDENMCGLAKEHNDLMLEGKRGLGHDNHKDRFKKIPNYRAASESVGCLMDQDEPINQLFQKFVDGPDNKNLLGNYNSVGISIGLNARGRWFVTQIFALIQE